MAVNLPPPDPASLHPVAGLELGVAMAGIKKPNRRDLLVMRLAPGSAVAGVFTRNRFCAAPVLICRKNLRNGVRALVVNTGNANAGTGEDGMKRAQKVCSELARLAGCKAGEVLPFSTGVIMEPLPVDRIVAGLPQALEAKSDWLSAAEAIMTTDTVPKAFSRKVKLTSGEATITGIAKGAGMIRPDMATMLGFIATDAKVARRTLQALLERRGRTLTRKQLLEQAWDVEADVSGRLHTRTVDMHVKRLRSKLGEAGEWLETIRGFGYRLRTPDT